MGFKKKLQQRKDCQTFFEKCLTGKLFSFTDFTLDIKA